MSDEPFETCGAGTDILRLTLLLPHLGHGALSPRFATRSSKSVPHLLHENSYMGMTQNLVTIP
jgi:hypothetical protein